MKILYRKSSIVIFNFSILIFLCYSCSADIMEKSDMEGSSKKLEFSKKKLSVEEPTIPEELRAKLLESVRDSIPNWDPKELMKMPSSPNGIKLDDPLNIYELINDKSSVEFKFVETRSNGRDVFKKGNDQTVKYNKEIGYWSFISPEKQLEIETDQQVTNEAVEKKIEAYYKKLSLHEDEIEKIFSNGVGVSDEQQVSENTGTLVARLGLIYRKINGLRVIDSRVLAVFNVDGSLSRFEIRWPEFTIKKNCTIFEDTTQFSKTIENSLSEIFGKVTKIEYFDKSRLAYEYNESTGEHRPVLFMYPKFEQEDVTQAVVVSLCKDDYNALNNVL